MDTGRGVLNTGVYWGEIGEGKWRVGSWGEITLGEIPNVSDGVMNEANHHDMYIPM